MEPEVRYYCKWNDGMWMGCPSAPHRALLGERRIGYYDTLEDAKRWALDVGEAHVVRVTLEKIAPPAREWVVRYTRGGYSYVAGKVLFVDHEKAEQRAAALIRAGYTDVRVVETTEK